MTALKLTDSKTAIVQDNILKESQELIEITLPIAKSEAFEVEVLEIELSEIEALQLNISEAKETKTNVPPQPKTQPAKIITLEKSEQYEQAEKRLIGFMVFFLVLLEIGSLF